MLQRSWLTTLYRQLTTRTAQRGPRSRRLVHTALPPTMELLEARVVPAALVQFAQDEAQVPRLSPTLVDTFDEGAVILRTRTDGPPESAPPATPPAGGSLRPPTNLLGAGLQFNLVPATGMSAQAIAGFQAAADLWSAILHDDIVVNINIDFRALGNGILGQTQSFSHTSSVSSFKTALAADAKSVSDQTAVANLPAVSSLALYTSDPNTGSPGVPFTDNNGTTNNSTMDINDANAKALGLRTANNISVDGSIAFSTAYNWDFDRSNNISGSAYDFIGVAAHEIGHCLGFVSGADSVDYYSGNGSGGHMNLDNFAVISPLDMFRYSAASESAGANIDIRADTLTKYFSIDGGTTQLTTYSTGVQNGDGRQCSHWKDNLLIGIMDPTGAPGEYMDVTDFDVQAFDVIGWDVSMDLGDAADTGVGTGVGNYQSKLNDNGPRHGLFKASGLITDQTGAPKVYLGSGVTNELNALTDPTATADTDNGIASFPTFPRGVTTNVTVTSTGAGAKLNYFVDFNQDGDFLDPGESLTQVTLSTASQSVPIVVPASAAGGNTIARFRISTAGGLSATGPANDGEVEDYQITIANTVPVALASSVTTNEDTAKTFAVSDFLFSDVDGDSLASITLASLSLASGDLLRLSGVDVTSSQTITAANIPNLVYTPAANANGAARSSFTFKANDSGNGSVAATMTINVNAVNDPPVALTSSVTTIEDTAWAFALSDFLFSDVESNSAVSVRIGSATLAAGDTLQLSGVDVIAPLTIPVGNIANLVYTPAPNANGAARSTFSFFVNDTFSGTVAATMTINVTPVNDVPVAQASSATTNEDTARIFAVSDFSFTDADGDGLASITINSVSLAGGDTLQLSGFNVNPSQTISAASIPSLVYTPALNTNGAARSSFDFSVNDSASGTVVATMTLNVTPVNDVPVAQGSSVTTNEDTAKTFAVSDFGFTDIEGNSLASISISSLSLASGDTLKLSGADVTANQTISAANIPSLVYTPAPNVNGASRSSFNFKVNDAGSGTVAATMTVNVAAVNDAPLLDNTFTPMLPALPMPQPKNAVIAGTPISKLVAHVSDIDPDPKGIAVTHFDFSGGQWQYSVDNGDTWTKFPDVRDDSALLLANDGLTQVRFIPNKASKGVKAFTKGFADLTYQAWDQSDGATPVTPLVNPVGTAFSPQKEQAWVMVGKTIPVVDVNGHPVLKADPIGTPIKLAKPSAAFTVKKFLGLLARETDPTPPTTVFGIAVSNAIGFDPTFAGEWQFNLGKGGWQSVGTVNDGAALLLRPTDRVRFVPGPTYNGNAELTYHTWDLGGGTFGQRVPITVTNFSAATETAIINAAPILVPAHPTLPSVQAGTMTPLPVSVSTLLGTAVTDVEQTKFGMYVSAPKGGTWEYSLNGTSWVKVTKGVYLESTAQLRFTAPTKAKVGAIASLTFKAWDQTVKSPATLSKALDKITVTIIS